MNNKQEISRLIKGCKNQNRLAQKELYLLFADPLMKVALRYAKDMSSAKDLIHDTFLKVFKNIEKFKEQGASFEGWLTRILINEALQDYRKSKRMILIQEDSLLEEQSETISIIEKLAADDILKVIRKLPEGCQMVFNLFVIEGYKHQEIGELLNITASASRSQLTRAKKLLRQLLNENKSAQEMNKKQWKKKLKRS